MDFENFDDRNWLILIVLGFLGIVLLIHGAAILWNLKNSNNLFTWNSALDSLGSVSELVVGFVFVLFAIFQNSVLEALDELLNWIKFY